MRRASFALLVLALLGLSVLAIPASAFHEPAPPPLLASHALSEPGWFVAKLAPVGNALIIDMEAQQVVGTATFGLALLGEGDHEMGMFTFTFVARGGTAAAEVHVRSDPVGLDRYVVGEEGEFTSTGAGLRWTCDCLADLRYVALWGADAFASADLRIHMDAHLLGTTSGDGAFAHDEDEFESVAGADATALLVANAFVEVVATKTKHVSGRLVGAYWPAPYQAGVSLAQTPAGTELCRCIFLTAAYGPGTYAFHLDGAAAGGGAGVILTGADVTFPE